VERGQIAEQGRHDELLLNPDGIYNHLYQLQLGGPANAAQIVRQNSQTEVADEVQPIRRVG